MSNETTNMNSLIINPKYNTIVLASSYENSEHDHPVDRAIIFTKISVLNSIMKQKPQDKYG